jgi:hypothetical protein
MTISRIIVGSSNVRRFYSVSKFNDFQPYKVHIEEQVVVVVGLPEAREGREDRATLLPGVVLRGTSRVKILLHRANTKNINQIRIRLRSVLKLIEQAQISLIRFLQ